MKRPFPFLFACFIAIVLSLVGCEASPLANNPHEGLSEVKLGQGEQLQVVATTSIVADIVRNVGGEVIHLTTLLPVGADPHTFQATPRDVAALSQAHLIVANGAGLEEFLDPLIESAKSKSAVIYLSEGIALRHLGEQEDNEHESGAEQESEHGHAGADPHTWTTPANAIVFAQNAERALSTLDPKNATTYKANADAYIAQLEDLDAWVREQIETIPIERRKLVTDHMVYGYYADRYGLEQVGAVISSFSTAAEPGAKEIAELEQVILEQHVPAVFVGFGFNPSLVERIAADTGIQVVALYDGTLGPAGSGAETYIQYVRYNTTAIVNALRNDR